MPTILKKPPIQFPVSPGSPNNQVEATNRALNAVGFERARQRELLARRIIPFDCSSGEVPLPLKLCVLTEEVGEVAEAIQTLIFCGQEEHAGCVRHLHEELIQTAAVAVAIAESLLPELQSNIRPPKS